MKQQPTTSMLPNVPVTENKDLDKLRTEGLFQDKVDKANEMLRKDEEARQRMAANSINTCQPLEDINAVKVSRTKVERLNGLLKGVPLPAVTK